MLARQLLFADQGAADLDGTKRKVPIGGVFESPISVLDAKGVQSPALTDFTSPENSRRMSLDPQEPSPVFAHNHHSTSSSGKPGMLPPLQRTPSSTLTHHSANGATPFSPFPRRRHAPLDLDVSQLGTLILGGGMETPERDEDCVTPKPSVSRFNTDPGAGWRGSSVPSWLLSETPATPVRGGTTGGKGLRKFNRSRAESLEKTKLLHSTRIKRTNSIMDSSLFRYNDHFEFEQVIGRSKNAEVWQVIRKTDGMTAHSTAFGAEEPERTAIKRLLHPFASARDKEDKIKSEVAAFEKLGPLGAHPNVVELYRAWQQDMHLHVQMELCLGGTLTTCLQQCPKRRVPAGVRMRLVHEIAAGLAHIHRASLLHLDIKPDNIFLDSPDIASATFKIGDFGLAVTADERGWEDGDGGYVAPELLCGGSKATPAADMYSFGVTLYECFMGHPLVRQQAMDGTLDFGDLPGELQMLTLSMLDSDPLRRPTAEQVVLFTEQHGGDMAPVPAPSPAPQWSVAGLPRLPGVMPGVGFRNLVDGGHGGNTTPCPPPSAVKPHHRDYRWSMASSMGDEDAGTSCAFDEDGLLSPCSEDDMGIGMDGDDAGGELLVRGSGEWDMDGSPLLSSRVGPVPFPNLATPRTSFHLPSPSPPLPTGSSSELASPTPMQSY